MAEQSELKLLKEPIAISKYSLTYFLDEIESIDGEKVFVLNEPSSYSSYSTRKPAEISEEVSYAIVYITTRTRGSQKYLGNGFIIDPKGIIVTNLHILQDVKQVNVKLKDGRIYPITGYLYYDAQRDICILKINTNNLPTVPLGDSNYLRVGQKLYCIDNTLGPEYSFSEGLLSQIYELNNIKYLQFTAPVSKGNSRGPLLNSQGEVVGVVTFLIRNGQNLNIALAINEIKPYLRKPLKPFSEFLEKVSKADYYFTEGNKYLFQKNYTKTIEYYQKALQSDPNNAFIYYNLGSIYVQLNQPQKAIEYYQIALQLDPNFVEVMC